MHDCLIPGCDEEGIWVLGIRARLAAGCKSWLYPDKQPTDAAFAPNLPAWLCDEHVNCGALLTLLVEPRNYHATRVRALGAPEDHPHRTVKIQ